MASWTTRTSTRTTTASTRTQRKRTTSTDAGELVRRAFDAWNHDDFEAAAALFSPDVEWRASGVFPGVETVYHGTDGVRNWWRALKEPFEYFDVDPVRWHAEGDRIAIHTHFRARGKESGADVELDFVDVWHLRDGLVATREAEPATPETLARHGLDRDVTELVRRAFLAWSENDLETLLSTVHPEVEWHTLGNFLGLEPVYRGHEGLLRLRAQMLEAFERIEMVPTRIVEEGDRVHALVHWHARGKGSGADVEFATIEHFEIAGDRAIRRTAEQSTPEGLERYGLAG